MGLHKRQQIAIGLGILSLAALGADRFFILPGPSSASAGQVAAFDDVAAQVDLDALEAQAESLSRVCVDNRMQDFSAPVLLTRADPFVQPWVDAQPEQPNRPSSSSSAKAPSVQIPNLSAVVTIRGQGYAVLNGKPLAVGASRDGYTLLELSDTSAKVSINGSIFTIPLRTGETSP